MKITESKKVTLCHQSQQSPGCNSLHGAKEIRWGWWDGEKGCCGSWKARAKLAKAIAEAEAIAKWPLPKGRSFCAKIGSTSNHCLWNVHAILYFRFIFRSWLIEFESEVAQKIRMDLLYIITYRKIAKLFLILSFYAFFLNESCILDSTNSQFHKFRNLDFKIFKIFKIFIF